MSDLEWHGDDARNHVHRRIVQYLTRAAIVVKREAKRLLIVPGTGRRAKSGRIVRHTGGRHKKIYGAFPSSPGEPPHKQTGRLWASVAYDVDAVNLVARVGTNVPYGKHLELGTKRGIAPRPWLRPALARVQSQVNSLLSSIGD